MRGHQTFVIIMTAGEELFACDSVVLIYPGELEGLQVEDIKKPPTAGIVVARLSYSNPTQTTRV